MAAPPTPAPAAPPPRPFLLALWRNRELHDVLFRLLCRAAAISLLVILALLIVFLVKEAWPAIVHFGPAFLVTPEWDPRGKLGAVVFIWGTVITSALAMLLAVPLGVGTATYLAELAPGGVRRVGSFLIELLAAIPSVVYGFWGLYFLAPVLQFAFVRIEGPLHRLSEVPGLGWVYENNASGQGVLAASIILAIMIVPYVTAITFDVCRAVPRSQREGALALGSTRWQMIWKAVLPYARPGIVGGCFLALGRALGETMAVVMLIGNYNSVSFSPLGKGATIASVIANELNESQGLKRSALVELGLVLLLVTIVINCLARVLIWRVGRTGRRRAWFGLASLFGPRRPPAPADPAPGHEPEAPAPGPRHEPEAPAPEPVTPAPQPLQGGRRFAEVVNRIMTVVLTACFGLTAVPLFLILGYITLRGATALDWSFFTHLPLDDPPGLRHALYGSAMLVGFSTLFAVPLGILTAIFLAEDRASRLAPVVRFVGELLGGVPSIIMGVFGYAVLVAPREQFSGWAGILALSVMMVPIVMRASEEALKLVPQSLRNASYALGAAYWQTVLRVTVPAALPAIITGVFLAIARIAGETAPLLLTADSTLYPVVTPDGRTPYLTYYIYFWAQDPDDQHKRLAWAAAFVLLAVVMALNVGIRLVTGKRVVSAARAD
jgi:phosphate transport system permease protein